MTRVICPHNKCTGCAVCRDICPKKCISMLRDELDATHPVIDEQVCISCGLCEKTCPNNVKLVFRQSQKVWAAWSNDEAVRKNSASGGIAFELYRHWLDIGGVAAGVVYDRNEGCHFILIKDEAEIASTQNSKYTFSDTCGIYRDVKNYLDSGIPVLFIGVPCQVAGLLSYLKKDYSNLTTVDIICHGMPPATYLQQHIKSIEDKRKRLTKYLSFRDPKFETYTFTFTLRDSKGRMFYKRNVLDTDNFQLGYHKALIYRENCYNCIYACKERISDLTIGDFSGLGRCAPLYFARLNTSCVLQNTDKGADLLSQMRRVSMIQRPSQEAFDFEKQLNAPSMKHPMRDVFVNVYSRSKNFKLASNKALAREKVNAVKHAIIQKIKVFVYNLLVITGIKKG